MAVMVKTDGKNLITIQVNFVLIPSETGMKQHKLTLIVAISDALIWDFADYPINRYYNSDIGQYR